jgi:hypothetical protein
MLALTFIFANKSNDPIIQLFGIDKHDCVFRLLKIENFGVPQKQL